jgi:CBS domain-containing protein
MKTLKDVMTDEVVYLQPKDTLRRAAEEMKRLNVGVIPICDDSRRLLGVITDRDIVVRAVAAGHNGDKPLEGLFTPDPVTGLRSWSVAEAAQIMSLQQIRRLPIVENGKLVGIVSLGDIAVEHGDEQVTGEALAEISQPAMPRQGGVEKAQNRA